MDPKFRYRVYKETAHVLYPKLGQQVNIMSYFFQDQFK
jgi:hypothetical protein